jgi:hypothetical protein
MQHKSFAMQQNTCQHGLTNPTEENVVKRFSVPIIAAAIAIAGGPAAVAAELPTYEASGFPISPVQLRLLGPANVREQPPMPSVVATPHQASVLTGQPVETTGTIAATGLAAR